MARTHRIGGGERLSHTGAAGDRLRLVADRAAEAEATLRARSAYLDDVERLLLIHSLDGTLTTRQLALLTGRSAGNVSRRISRIKLRLCDPVVAALCGPDVPLGEADRRMALDHFLNRHRIGDLARLHGLTRPVVRRRLNFVRGWVQGRRDAARGFRDALAAQRRAAAG